MSRQPSPERAASDGHVARKRFGQHFLHDRHLIGRIVDAIRPRPQDVLIEIGPGLAALTDPVVQALQTQASDASADALRAAGHPLLHVIELDRDLAEKLRGRYDDAVVRVHESDVLKFDFGSIGGALRVIGNLPYNISSPILFALMPFADRVIDQHFMLQKEVIDRMVAEPGSKTYGRLSVMLQARYQMRSLMRVPPGAFNPPPKVDSAIVRMVPLPADNVLVQDWARFGDLVATAFGQRRKMLRGTIGRVLPAQAFEAAQVDPQARPEQLDVAAFARLLPFWPQRRVAAAQADEDLDDLAGRDA